MPTNVTSLSQLQGILSSNSLVVIDFHATWCPPCKAIAPVYDALASQYEKKNTVIFTKCDTDQAKDVAVNYNVTAMPTFVFILNKKEVGRIRGADANQLRSDIQKFAAMAKPASGAGFSGTGHKLGSEGRSASSSRPSAVPKAKAPAAGGGRTVGAQSNGLLSGIVQGIIVLATLYFVSLFSLDPKGAAEKWLRSNR